MRLNQAEVNRLRSMPLVQRADGWWFKWEPYTVDGVTEDHCGPWGTKQEADDSRRSFAKTLARLEPTRKVTQDGEEIESDESGHQQEARDQVTQGS